MSQKEMFLTFIWKPLFETFSGIFNHMFVLLVFYSGTIGGIAVGLFETPEIWWMALLMLVLIDWLGGIVTAVYRGDFDIRKSVRKWYHVAGYIFVCGAAGVLANAGIQTYGPESVIGSGCYHFQFLVYASFSAKEFMSILRMWGVLAFFMVVWDMVLTRDFSVEKLKKLSEEAEKHQKNND